MVDDLAKYYEQELSALRHLSQEFAARYPKIAGRLLIESGGGSADPHVERMMQAFAFLTGRVQKKIDDSFPEITNAFFEILYPHYLQPLPSHTIVQFDTDQNTSPLTGHYPVEKGTTLLSPPLGGLQCKFKTCYPVDIWPIKVKDISFDPIGHTAFTHGSRNTVGILRISMETIGTASLDQLDIKNLRFFIDGDKSLAFNLYELIFNNTEHVLLTRKYGEAGPKAVLPSSAITPVGFNDKEGILDYSARSFTGYRLLQEYFTYPEKFLFFDVNQIDKLNFSQLSNSFELVFFIKEFERPERLEQLAQNIDKKTLKPFCTPAINLFKQRAEPIQVSHLKTEYRVIPQRRWPLGMEVYSIDEVTRVRRIRGYDQTDAIPPMFDLKPDLHLDFPEETAQTFWYARRRQTFRENDNGTEVYISLIDRALNPSSPTDDVIAMTINCTNRDLPNAMPIGNEMGDLEFEGADPVAIVRCLRKPSKSQRPKLGKDAYWRLISHLSLNHLSIVENGREALLEILNLYNFSNSMAQRQEISGITKISNEPIIQRVGPPLRSTFCRGTRIHLEFDENNYIGSGVFLFSCILERFFSLYCAANSFTQLSVTTKQREKELNIWPARLGNALLI